MSKISINGIVRDMTQEEIEEMAAHTPEVEPTAEERLAALEEALLALLEGETD